MALSQAFRWNDEVQQKLRRIMVLGAGGVGEVVTKGLLRLESVEKIWIADIDEDRAREVADHVSDPRLSPVQMDAGDVPALTAALKDCGIVVHAGLPRNNLHVMEACLQSSCHYIDMASDGPVDMPGIVTIQDQLEYDEAFRARGLMAILGIGSDPGVTNVLARYAYDQLKRMESVVVYDGDNSTVKNQAFVIAFSPEVSIEENLQPPLIYDRGRWITGIPLETGIEQFDFPSPVGTLTVRSVAHEEVYTIPRFLGQKGLHHCEFKYALSQQYVDILKSLQLIGLDREDPVQVGDVTVSPRKVVASLLPKPASLADSMEGTACVGVKVKGIDERDRPVEMFLYTIQSHEYSRKDMGVNVTVFQAGIPAVVAVELMLGGVLGAVGVCSPEQFDPEPWIERLPRWGMPLYMRKTVTEAL
ncbi:MAG: saccharopine dehydrogenase NADP-binding domain-containing protein [Hydrogenibacillus sp.]|nr:saccharopine dehydrogenase NADP-binding domain-containing protein [Hydrogenibacillus sp.]